jgi:hypothetical protein
VVGYTLADMKHLLALAALASIATPAHADDSKKYTLADLKALIEQKGYQEAIDHMKDISPSERKTEWIDIAGTAGAGLVTGAPDAGTKLSFMVQVEKDLPAILKSPKYLTARADAAGAAFNACFNHGDFQQCRDYALVFVDADPKNAKLTLDIAKAVRLGMSHFAAVPFFKRALAAGKPATVCADEDLSLAVVSGLGLNKTDSKVAESVAIGTTCWKQIKDAVLKELMSDSGKKGHFHDNACELVKANKAATGDVATRCAPQPN